MKLGLISMLFISLMLGCASASNDGSKKIVSDNSKKHCDPDAIKDRTKCTSFGYVLNDPSDPEEYLKAAWTYYSVEQKKPELFKDALNVKNAKGESVLDSVENLRRGEGYKEAHLQAKLDRAEKLACEHGGEYFIYKDKGCKK